MAFGLPEGFPAAGEDADGDVSGVAAADRSSPSARSCGRDAGAGPAPGCLGSAVPALTSVTTTVGTTTTAATDTIAMSRSVRRSNGSSVVGRTGAANDPGQFNPNRSCRPRGNGTPFGLIRPDRHVNRNA
ncbi:hypothetical protein GCM10009678_89330 [Actinomadura kijaniata]